MLIFEKLIQKRLQCRGFGPVLQVSGEKGGPVGLHCKLRSLSSPARLDGLGTMLETAFATDGVREAVRNERSQG